MDDTLSMMLMVAEIQRRMGPTNGVKPVKSVKSPRRLGRNTGGQKSAAGLVTVRPKHPEERLIRIFLSSTFSDMLEERNLMATRVYPEVVRMCETVGVVPVFIDLRWGVTQEQMRTCQGVVACLNEVQRSDVFFGFIGMRYGWHDHGMGCLCGATWNHTEGNSLLKKSMEVAMTHLNMPWIKSYGDRSITELEIRCAEKYVHPSCQFFYLRDSSVGQPEASPKGLQRLDSLRKELSSAAQVYNTADDALAEKVIKDIKLALDTLYPLASKPHKWDRERNIHTTRSVRVLHATVDRQELVDPILKALKSSPPFVCVQGDAGSGKSALLSVLAQRTPSSILHFIGCTADSVIPSKIARRLLHELNEPCNADDDQGVFEDLAEALQKKSPLIILLDGVDSLSPTPNLQWVPTIPGVTWVVSSRSPTVFANLPGPLFHCRELEKQQSQAAALKYLQIRGKTLSSGQLGRILGNKCHGNPLFLRLVLHELCTVGNFESLDSRIDHYCSATSLTALISLILQRLSGTLGRAAVGNVCAALCLSQIGLTESELCAATHSDAATIVSLVQTLEPIIIQRAGTLIADTPLRDAITNSILAIEENVTRGHQMLASFFLSIPLDKRVLRELPFHLVKCGDFTTLRDILKKPWVLMEMFHDHKRGEYISLLTTIKENLGVDSVVTMFNFDEFQSNYGQALTLCRIMGLMGFYAVTKSFLIKLMENAPTAKKKSDIYHRIAMSDISLGNFQEAEANALKAFSMRRQSGENDWFLEMDSQRLVALTLKKQGKYNESLKMYRDVIQQAQHKLSPSSTKFAHLYEEMGDILRKIGNYNEAATYHTKSLDIKRKMLGEDNVSTCMAYYDLSMTHKKQGKYSQSMKEVDVAIVGFERAYGSQHPQLGEMLSLKADLLRKISKFTEALNLYKRVLDMNVTILGENHIDTAESYCNYGLCLKKMGRYTEAEQALQISKRAMTNYFGTKSHAKLAEVHGQLGDVQRRLGYLEESLVSYNTSLDMYKEIFGPSHPDVAESHMRLGLTYLKLDKPEALELFKVALSIFLLSFSESHEKVATCYMNMGDAHRKNNDLLLARDSYETALRINREVHGVNHIEVAECLYKLGRLYKKLHWYNDASTKFYEALSTAQKALGTDRHIKVATMLIGVADVERKLMSFEGSEAKYRDALKILKEFYPTNPQDDVAECLNGLGMCAGQTGRKQEGISLLMECITMTETLLGPSHRHTLNRKRNLLFISSKVDE